MRMLAMMKPVVAVHSRPGTISRARGTGFGSGRERVPGRQQEASSRPRASSVASGMPHSLAELPRRGRRPAPRHFSRAGSLDDSAGSLRPACLSPGAFRSPCIGATMPCSHPGHADCPACRRKGAAHRPCQPAAKPGFAKDRGDAFGEGAGQLRFPVRTPPRAFRTGRRMGNVASTPGRSVRWCRGGLPPSAAFDDPCRDPGEFRKPLRPVDRRQGLAAPVGRSPDTGDFAGDLAPVAGVQRGQRPFAERAVALGGRAEIVEVTREELAVLMQSQDGLPGKDFRHGFERQAEPRLPLHAGPVSSSGSVAGIPNSPARPRSAHPRRRRRRASRKPCRSSGPGAGGPTGSPGHGAPSA